MNRARRTATERFAICVTPGDRKTLVALLGVSPTGGKLSVRRAAVRSSREDRYTVQAVSQMYRTSRHEAPTVLIIAHTPGHDVTALMQKLRTQIGPFADISAVPVGTYRAGTWGTAVRGAASGLGLAMDSEEATDAVTLLAKECELRATGPE